MPRIGLISDTHGLLRPEAVAFLQGCDHIIHAGDIGGRESRPSGDGAEILDQLSQLAPLSAVRGNNDRAAWARDLPETQLLRFDSVQLYVIHDLACLDLEPQAAQVAAVISGHSHQPTIRERAGVLYVNPGSAGPRRFKLPIAVGELMIAGSSVTARIVDLLA